METGDVMTTPIVLCQKCLAVHEAGALFCNRCHSQLVVPSIPPHLSEDADDFVENEFVIRMRNVEQSVSIMARKLRDVFALNRQLLSQVTAGSFKTALLTGYFLRNQGRHREAVPYFQRSIQLNGKSLAANAFMGLTALESKDSRKAVEYFEKSARLEPSPTVYYMLGVAYYLAARPGKALEALERALVQNPNYSPACLLIANVAYKRGWKRRSRRHLGQLSSRKGNVLWSGSDEKLRDLFRRQDENLLHSVAEDPSLTRYLLREVRETT